MSERLDGGEAILEAFRKLGVEYVLSSPGTEWAPVWEAIAKQISQGKNGPRLLDCWHETLAVNIAAGYTLATGRMQGVLLHAGSGLLQGSMGIHGARVTGVPMVVISGESMTYGEDPAFDPGGQWISNLSIPGGTTNLVDGIVKYASQAGSPHTIYESVIRAGELAQRTPHGPTYLSVSTETLMDQWVPPADSRTIPAAPRILTAPEDIDMLVTLLARAKNPVVLTEAAGREPETYQALVELCELLALPVVEKPAALFANFPKDHPLHQGHDLRSIWNDIDLAIVIRTRVPWYPPRRRPPNAVIAVIDETPHRDSMVYQSHHADLYLEGNVAQTLRDLAAAMRARGLDAAAIAEKRSRLAAAHEQLEARKRAQQAEARQKRPIDPVWLCAALGETMPRGTIYIDEVTTHTNIIREHVRWSEPQSLFTRQGGLGQGLGLALGIKLAKPERPVVALIGDGAMLYNPTLGCFGAAREYRLPIMAVIFNNKKYAAMQQMHLKMYPGGTAVQTETFHGTHIQGPDFTKVAESCGAYAERVEDPEKLPDALRRGLEATNKGMAAIIDVAVR